jgi:nitrate/nitrite transport system permease protein
VSLLLLAILLGVWHLATLPKARRGRTCDPEYAKLMGLDKPKSDGLPTLAQLAVTAWKQLSNPFYDAGSNDKGIGIQLAYLARARGPRASCSPRSSRFRSASRSGSRHSCTARSNPFIQVLKPISPLAWMPLALYTIKDSATSSIFVIFICSTWPMLINTAMAWRACGATGSTSPRPWKQARCAPASR